MISQERKGGVFLERSQNGFPDKKVKKAPGKKGKPACVRRGHPIDWTLGGKNIEKGPCRKKKRVAKAQFRGRKGGPDIFQKRVYLLTGV